MEKIKRILESQLSEIKLNEKETEKIEKETEKFVEKLEKAVKRKRIKAEVFVGGSLAKNTLIKKKVYDIDIFIRFESGLDKIDEIIKTAGIKALKVHGSRDYFRTKGEIIFEIVPVLKIKKPEQAENVTDLSYFHVSYILKQIKKNKKLNDEIRLAKAFTYAQGCYGAESYIKGFSGYAIELLVSYYGSFLSFIKAVAKSRDKIVIDPLKAYKNKQELLISLSESKLQSPIIFVDPTFKERNSLAALSNETFEKFKEACIKFLKKPSKILFILQKPDRKKFNFILEARTSRQEGDVAGSKLLKFFKLFSFEMEKYFSIVRKDFVYEGKKAEFYFSVKRKKEIIMQGPPINKIENVLSFKQAHKNIFIKKRKVYAKEKISLSWKSFLTKFKKENSKRMKEMNIIKLEIV